MEEHQLDALLEALSKGMRVFVGPACTSRVLDGLRGAVLREAA